MQHMCLHLYLFSFRCNISGMLFLTVDFHAQKKLCQHENATHRSRYMHSSQFQISTRAKEMNLLISYQYFKPYQNIEKYEGFFFFCFCF